MNAFQSFGAAKTAAGGFRCLALCAIIMPPVGRLEAGSGPADTTSWSGRKRIMMLAAHFPVRLNRDLRYTLQGDHESSSRHSHAEASTTLFARLAHGWNVRAWVEGNTTLFTAIHVEDEGWESVAT